jgi:LmbE family N-acetylglucosaminyl deacetylase
MYFSNKDHRALGRVVLDNVWPAAQAPNAFLDLQKEGYQIHKVKEVWLWQTDQPNLHLDITDYFETKRAAIACHKSQRTGPNTPNLILRRWNAVTAAKGQTLNTAVFSGWRLCNAYNFRGTHWNLLRRAYPIIGRIIKRV